tara:strand:+ start:6518 stop:6736 length:219 start_codon:yes stop_codon:yes gene_type:complete
MNQRLVVVLTLLFFVVSNPMMYDLVDRYIPVKESGIPSQIGVFLHALVFILILSILASENIVGNAAIKLPKN